MKKEEQHLSIYWQLIQNSSLVIISLIVFVGVIELSFRFIAPNKRSDPLQKPFIKDPVLGHVGRPNYHGWNENPEYGRIEVQTNANGFRDHRNYPEKEPGTFRILGIGDSFTWGDAAPYNDTYLRVAEKKIQDNSSLNVEIVKAGFSAYTLTQEVLFFKTRGKQFQPDLVTIGFLPNDLVSSYPLTLDGMGLQKPENPYGLLNPSFFMKTAMLLSEKSRFYKWLKALMLKNDRIYIKAYLSRGGEDSYVSKDWSPRYLKQLELVRDLLSELKKTVKENNSELVLIFIPQRFQILVAKNRDFGDRYQADKLNQEIEKICNDLGIYYLDTFPDLLKVSEQGPVFYTVDGHLNPRSYRIVGEVLADFLLQKGLVTR